MICCDAAMLLLLLLKFSEKRICLLFSAFQSPRAQVLLPPAGYLFHIAPGRLELGGLGGAPGGVSFTVSVRARTRELPVLRDEVLVPDRLVVEVRLEDLVHTGDVAVLRRKGGSGDVRGHPVVGHRAPRVVLRRGLREPDVARVPAEVA